ncbi:hypothetical protein BaRGS_00018864 [Batillaria attramentaria]|uniref:Uncharacterized protein n=1 Tax=Batillaria attramentaria TaxID=370345 RepID=A0ABD0KRD6_9CAEN
MRRTHVRTCAVISHGARPEGGYELDIQVSNFPPNLIVHQTMGRPMHRRGTEALVLETRGKVRMFLGHLKQRDRVDCGKAQCGVRDVWSVTRIPRRLFTPAEGP